ncbi:hypothetical protein Tco_0345236 [Tanacetum coccineum]
MVACLERTEGNADFPQIVDFLNASTIRQAKRGRDTEIPQSGGPLEKVGDEAVHKELGDRVERAATTTANLDAEQDIGGSPRCQEAIGGTIAQTRSERVPTSSYDSPLLGGNTLGSDEERLEQHELTDNVSPTPHDSPLLGGHTPGSDEGRLKQDKLTNIVTTLSQKVEGLESDLKKTKKLYATTFKKLINRGRSLIEEMDLDAGISLVPPHVEVQGRYGQNLETQEGFGDGQEVSTVAQVSTASTFVSTASPQRNTDTTADDLTLAETLMEIRKSAAKDKGKAKIDETGSPRKMKQRERVQISRDEEGFTDAEWDDVLARVAADEDFVQQLQLEVQRLKREGQEVLEEHVKRQKIGEASGSGEEQSTEKEKELSEAEQQKLLVIVPVEELVIQPLQVRDDLVNLWSLVKERFSLTEPTDDKERKLWVKLKRLFEPNTDDELWKLQRHRNRYFQAGRKRISIDKRDYDCDVV